MLKDGDNYNFEKKQIDKLEELLLYANISKVDIGITGIFKASAIPFAQLIPTLRPVKDPGPLEIQIASKS